MRPRVGFKPTVPQAAAGIRIDPPPSLACAIGTALDATADPAPPLEPPVERSVSHGLRVGLKALGSVVIINPNSGVADFPQMSVPELVNFFDKLLLNFIGIFFTIIFSTNFSDLISIRIAFGSGIAFLSAQLLDVQIFDKLRKKKWYIAPLTSSVIASIVDTSLFFSISFYGTGVPWVTLSLGDLMVKLFVALLMLIPFRLAIGTLKAI